MGLFDVKSFRAHIVPQVPAVVSPHDQDVVVGFSELRVFERVKNPADVCVRPRHSSEAVNIRAVSFCDSRRADSRQVRWTY